MATRVTIYGIRNCDTMKKALSWLDAQGIDYEFHDYKRLGVPRERLKAWIAAVGWERLANTRGTTWRRIPEPARQRLDAGSALRLLCDYPSAIRRPVVEAGRKLLIGFDADEFGRTLSQ